MKGGSLLDCIALKARMLHVAPKTRTIRNRDIIELVGDAVETNWPARAEAIGTILREGLLDVYLLQEVGEEQLQDLAPYISEYESRFAVHPRP
jgi:hypothetical protein